MTKKPVPGCNMTTYRGRLRSRGHRCFGKGQTGSALMGSPQISCFLTGTFWVLTLTYFYLPKSAMAYLFPQSVEIHYFCSGPISVHPICPQPRAARQGGGRRGIVSFHRLSPMFQTSALSSYAFSCALPEEGKGQTGMFIVTACGEAVSQSCAP